MYSSIPSLSVSSSTALSASVLATFPPDAAHSVVQSVVRSVAANLGIHGQGHIPANLTPSVSSTSGLSGHEFGSSSHKDFSASDHHSSSTLTTTVSSLSAPASGVGAGGQNAIGGQSLKTEAQITWFMEVVCHGLSLPLHEHDTIKDCVNIYCEWLSALLPAHKPCVPAPIVDEPNRYARKIISHLYHLFVPRKGEAQETIHKQAVLCHRVLRRIQDVVQQSQSIDRETWEAVLCFLLAINDALLAPPAVKDDVGDQLCERVLGVLYEIWLLACVKCFPSPPLWKTFREMCLNWRHRNGLVEQWNRINMALTTRLLAFMYGPDFPQMKIPEEDSHLIPPGMTDDCVAQAWYRFVHSLGNPVDLSRPGIVSQTQHFYQYAIVAENVIDPTHHPCLSALPGIFLKAMKGIAAMVDAYLGLPKASQFIGLSRSTSTTSAPQNHSLTSTSSSMIGFTGICERPAPSPKRPKCNSILHMYGKWLFEAAFIGTEYALDQSSNPAQPGSGGKQGSQLPTSKVKIADHRRSSSSSTQGSTSLTEGLDLPATLNPERFESGRAEALGTLCRIFCAKKTGEEILPTYLARFYLAVQQGLTVQPDKIVSEVLAMILVNSCDLLRLDLDGACVLLPYLLSALESILPERDLKMRPTNVSKTDLRRAAINILVSMLALPAHFQNLPIKELVAGSTPGREAMTFTQLKPRIVNLLINALQVESEAVNTQLLLGGLMFVVQDSSILESFEQKAGSHQQDTDRVASANDSGNFNSLGTLGSTLSDISNSNEDPNSDSAHAVFVRATYLVCHRLISSWKSDLNTSLAALELLNGLARINLPTQDPLESKRAVKWTCDYIVTQCSRPPPAHSKDLHSSIVAAFRCLQTWLLAHPYLLKDKESIATVMEVVEQGISGSKSRNKASDEPIFKEEKQLSPASRRVRDAAESVLTAILEQAEYFPSSCGAESLSTLLDEVALLRHCGSGEIIPMTEAVGHFRYFVVDNSTIMAILEEPLGNEQNPQPTVTILLRTCSSRSAWSMQLRQLPRHQSGVKMTQVDPGRPIPLEERKTKTTSQPKFFPDSVDRIPLCKADKSIPAVESVAGDARTQMDLEHLSQLMDQQGALEDVGVAKAEEEGGFYVEGECHAPEPVTEFQTARLLLSHLGLLNMNSIRETTESGVPRLIALGTDSVQFVQDLEALDRLSPRTSDTVHLFYVRSGQKTSDDILKNVHSSKSVHPHFLEFLTSLGWPVNVWSHPGWTGHTSTSWREQSEPMTPPPWQRPQGSGGGGAYNGDHYALYWADASSEIAFVVPTFKDGDSAGSSPKRALSAMSGAASPGPSSIGADDRLRDQEDDTLSTSSSNRPSLNHTTSLNLDMAHPGGGLLHPNPNMENSARKKFNRSTSSAPNHEVKVMVIWLERMEDSRNIGLDDLLGETMTGVEVINGSLPAVKDVFVIFIQPLTNGLLRIKMQGPIVKMNIATPLVDGMVVSRRCVGPLVRQTALNIAARRRLEMDSYQPPHVRRKQKVQEIVSRYRSHMTEAEFYSHLFNPSTH